MSTTQAVYAGETTSDVLGGCLELLDDLSVTAIYLDRDLYNSTVSTRSTDLDQLFTAQSRGRF